MALYKTATQASENTLFDIQFKVRNIKSLKKFAEKLKLSDRLPIDNMNALARKIKGPALKLKRNLVSLTSFQPDAGTESSESDASSEEESRPTM